MHSCFMHYMLSSETVNSVMLWKPYLVVVVVVVEVVVVVDVVVVVVVVEVVGGLQTLCVVDTRKRIIELVKRRTQKNSIK